MRRLKSALLMAVLATMSLGQQSMDFVTPEIKRVGDKLACLCGGCRNSVGNCTMFGCSYKLKTRERIQQLQTMGASDASIIGRMVKERGKQALIDTPTEGVGLLAWLLPVFAATLGLLSLWFYVRRFRAPEVVESPLPAEQVAPFADKAAEELERLESER
jgi:cytochrome c-type biogenesis protein CcmH